MFIKFRGKGGVDATVGVNQSDVLGFLRFLEMFASDNINTPLPLDICITKILQDT